MTTSADIQWTTVGDSSEDLGSLATSVGPILQREPSTHWVGVRRGGVCVAEALREQLKAGGELGHIDISLYRDDAATHLPQPSTGPSHIPFEVEGKSILLVDDVLHTGRTIRAALSCLLDYGRPKRVWLAVLYDRGGRELPIAADAVGRVLEMDPDHHLEVTTGDDGLHVRRRGPRFNGPV